ncbi:MAG TPA: RelA/SpoT domain-containing protein [Solirubrobacterales bacterium]|jgi:ppGpp synthetase/RelA/SpoT-type nucleotidyltranferase|nr:RelA/SpoT domain-containing protein [Solirubrobacterales bacterium]
MAFSKGEVNRAGDVIAKRIRDADKGRPLTAADEIAQLAAAIEVIDWWRSEHARPLTLVAANLRYYVAEVGDPVVAQRLKRLPTIAEKMVREPKMKLARMGDIGGVRAVVPSQSAAYHVARRLRKNWTITRFSDYVANPKPDGYRALHLINRHRGRLIEIQLRTRLQDNWANIVEVFSRTVAPGLKYGDGPSRPRQMLIDLAFAYAEIDAGEPSFDSADAKIHEIQAWVDSLKEKIRNES